MNTLPPVDENCWFLSGPTASGKTALGLKLARRLNAEIISLDSMAVYRGMDIGTAKPTLSERAAVPHHLIDVVEPNESFSLAQYVVMAHEAVRQIIARGRTPLFVGGTPLYLKAMLRGIFTGPEADWDLRHALREFANTHGDHALHARLRDVDPASAARLQPQDQRRLIRALEVWQKTGQTLSSFQQQFEHARPVHRGHAFILDWPTDQLNARIESRVDEMFAAGLVDEVRALLTNGQPLGQTAAQAVGYREVIEHLSGNRNLNEIIDLVKTKTRQFAKRQRTWFRSLAECRWVAMQRDADLDQLAERIARN